VNIILIKESTNYFMFHCRVLFWYYRLLGNNCSSLLSLEKDQNVCNVSLHFILWTLLVGFTKIGVSVTSAEATSGTSLIVFYILDQDSKRLYPRKWQFIAKKMRPIWQLENNITINLIRSKRSVYFYPFGSGQGQVAGLCEDGR